MNGLIAWWARNSVAANLVMIGIFVAGTIGFTQMEREMDPQVRFPGLQIEVFWPGAAPQEVDFRQCRNSSTADWSECDHHS